MNINPELERRVAQRKWAVNRKQSDLLHELKESKKTKNVTPGEQIFMESSSRMLEMFKRFAKQERSRMNSHTSELRTKAQET
jgi:hypothetical protein